MNAEKRRRKIEERICVRRYDTVANLAKEYKVSKRTILRDIVILTERIPIYTKSGRYGGGVYIDQQYHPRQIYFQREESELMHRILVCLEKRSFVPLGERDISALRRMLAIHENPNMQRIAL